MNAASDPNRKALAAAISLEAGARRDLQVAAQAAQLAASRHWEAQSKLDELSKVVAAPTGARAAEFIASVAAGAPCNVVVLERSAIDARAQIAAAENDVRVWEETSEQCALAVRTKEGEVSDAKELVEKAARAVICNSQNAARLIDELMALQSEVINRRSALRFLYRASRNGELERAERVLWQDLTGLESTPASAAWAVVYDALMTDPEVELPS